MVRFVEMLFHNFIVNLINTGFVLLSAMALVFVLGVIRVGV